MGVLIQPHGLLTGVASEVSAEQALVEYGRLVVAGLIGWLLLSTALAVVARLSGRLGLIRAAGWITLPFVRRMAERIVVGVLAIVAALGPVGRASAAVSAGAVVAAGRSGGSIGLAVEGGGSPVAPPAWLDGREARPSGAFPFDPSRPPPVAGELPEAGVPAAPEGSRTVEYVVVPGDNLWLIAERHLESVTGRSPADHETAPYWRELIARNRARLTSGDPDLIYPGEVIVCPPPIVEGPPPAP